MFYKSFSRILTIYGYLPQTSFSYFYSNLLLVLAILNLIASFVYFKIAELDYINITDIIATAANYNLQIVHCVVLANSVMNIGIRDKFYERLYEFDKEIADIFNFKVTRQAEVKLNRKILGGWIMSVSFISMATYHIVKDGVLVVLWLRVLPGIFSIQFMYIHIFYFVEQLKQRLVLYADILDDMISEETTTEFKILKMKKLYHKLIEIMDLINEIFGTDLIFIVLLDFLEFIYNIYLIFLDGFYLHDYSAALGILNKFTHILISLEIFYILVNFKIILPDAIYNTMLARSCDGCNFLVKSINFVFILFT